MGQELLKRHWKKSFEQLLLRERTGSDSIDN